MSEPISQEEYAGGKRSCPLCRSGDIIEREERSRYATPYWLYRYIECNNCGATWTETLKIYGYVDLDTKNCWIHAIREQLILMDNFMSKTPTHNPLWWCDEMPAYPDEYTPEEWQAENKVIFLVWLDYLAELEHQNLNEYRALADKLSVADLLAASKEESEKCSQAKSL